MQLKRRHQQKRRQPQPQRTSTAAAAAAAGASPQARNTGSQRALAAVRTSAAVAAAAAAAASSNSSDSTRRWSSNIETAAVLGALLTVGCRALCFTKVRRMCEILRGYTVGLLEASSDGGSTRTGSGSWSAVAARVGTYRGGYTADARCAILLLPLPHSPTHPPRIVAARSRMQLHSRCRILALSQRWMMDGWPYTFAQAIDRGQAVQRLQSPRGGLHQRAGARGGHR